MMVEELTKTMANIDRIHQISEFDPTMINFDHPFANSNVSVVEICITLLGALLPQNSAIKISTVVMLK
jgi:hypothetical protein